MSVMEPELRDPALTAVVELARAAAQVEAGDERVGEHVGAQVEAEAAVTHLFEADKAGYSGWRWAVTVASAGPGTEVSVSEVVLLPGPDALVAPEWVPWDQRVKAGDLGVGDLLPAQPDDSRLVPAYAESDDPAVEEVAREVGLGRVRVMARPARLEAATRWQHSEFGPRSDMARSAPAHCGTCGFYLPLAGSLRAAFGTCGNELSPADGHVVHAEYGCGAHSEAEVEQVSPVLVAHLIYDDAQLEVAPTAEPDEAEASPTSAAADTAADTAPAADTTAPEVDTDASATERSAAESSAADSSAAEQAATETAQPEPAGEGASWESRRPEPDGATPAEASGPTEPIEPAEASDAAEAGSQAAPTTGGAEPAEASGAAAPAESGGAATPTAARPAKTGNGANRQRRESWRWPWRRGQERRGDNPPSGG